MDWEWTDRWTDGCLAHINSLMVIKAVGVRGQLYLGHNIWKEEHIPLLLLPYPSLIWKRTHLLLVEFFTGKTKKQWFKPSTSCTWTTLQGSNMPWYIFLTFKFGERGGIKTSVVTSHLARQFPRSIMYSMTRNYWDFFTRFQPVFF